MSSTLDLATFYNENKERTQELRFLSDRGRGVSVPLRKCQPDDTLKQLEDGWVSSPQDDFLDVTSFDCHQVTLAHDSDVVFFWGVDHLYPMVALCARCVNHAIRTVKERASSSSTEDDELVVLKKIEAAVTLLFEESCGLPYTNIDEAGQSLNDVVLRKLKVRHLPARIRRLASAAENVCHLNWSARKKMAPYRRLQLVNHVVNDTVMSTAGEGSLKVVPDIHFSTTVIINYDDSLSAELRWQEKEVLKCLCGVGEYAPSRDD